MQGADEYAKLFPQMEQHGRLLLYPSSHARGDTFRIWVLPDESPVTEPPWRVPDAVEVYGITGGQPGWTETYGWLHRGPWVDDFETLVEQRRSERETNREARDLQDRIDAEQERRQIERLLARYPLAATGRPPESERPARNPKTEEN